MQLLPYYSLNWVLATDWEYVIKRLKMATTSHRNPMAGNDVKHLLKAYDLKIRNNSFRLKKRSWNPQALGSMVVARYKGTDNNKVSLSLTFRPSFTNLMTILLSYLFIGILLAIILYQYHVHSTANFWVISILAISIIFNKYRNHRINSNMKELQKALQIVLEVG